MTGQYSHVFVYKRAEMMAKAQVYVNVILKILKKLEFHFIFISKTRNEKKCQNHKFLCFIFFQFQTIENLFDIFIEKIEPVY